MSWFVLVIGLIMALVAARGPIGDAFGGVVDSVESAAIDEVLPGGATDSGNVGEGPDGEAGPGGEEPEDSADPGVGPAPEVTPSPPPPPAPDGTGETVGDARVRALAAVEGDDVAHRALISLLTSEAFSELPEDAQLALLAQVENYPDALAIENLERLAAKEWFQEMDLEDTQRAAKFVAALSVYEGGDATLLANSLDAILDPSSDITFGFKPYTNDPGTITKGSANAASNTFWLNEVLVSSGNDPLDLDFHNQTETGITDTFAHEVNHIVNGDTVSKTFDYFMAEYRANVVGATAQLGHTPTLNSDFLGDIKFLLDRPATSTSVYTNISDALADVNAEGTGEGDKIAAFVSEILGEEVAPDEVVAALGDAITAAEQAEADAAAAQAQWEQDVADALAAGDPVPSQPADVTFPTAPTPIPSEEGDLNVLDNDFDFPSVPELWVPPPPPAGLPQLEPSPPTGPPPPAPPPGAPSPSPLVPEAGAELPTIVLIDDSAAS